MRKPLSKFQIVCVVLLWAILCFFVLTRNEHLDGPTITSLLIATALVLIPVYKSLKKDK